MKKIINEPSEFTVDSLRGLAAAHSDLLTVSLDPMFVTRRDAPVVGKVALVSGGGSGHEPLHAGYVGLGMLAAAVPGAVFTSPTPDAVLAATKAVDGGAGVLHIVKNYTGDVLNFEMAAELLADDGVSVATALVADDIAVTDSTWTTGRRGVGGTVLLEKIAGAAAERGDDLDAVAGVAARVNAGVRSMGLALHACTVPHTGELSFELADDEMEVGIGIHGEPGRERRKMADATEIVAILLESIEADLPLGSGDEVLLFVNGMGATPLAEQYLAYGLAAAQLADRGVRVTRSLVGSYITALDMAGLSLTVLKLDDELTGLWDAPVHTPALRWGR